MFIYLHKYLPKGFLKPETPSDSFTLGTYNGYWHTVGTQCLLDERINDTHPTYKGFQVYVWMIKQHKRHNKNRTFLDTKLSPSDMWLRWRQNIGFSVAAQECGCWRGTEIPSPVIAAPTFTARQWPLLILTLQEKKCLSTILTHLLPPSTQSWDSQLPTNLTITWMRWCSGVYRWLKRAWYRTWALLYWSRSAAGCNQTNHPIKRKVSQVWQLWIHGLWIYEIHYTTLSTSVYI